MDVLEQDSSQEVSLQTPVPDSVHQHASKFVVLENPSGWDQTQTLTQVQRHKDVLKIKQATHF